MPSFLTRREEPGGRAGRLMMEGIVTLAYAWLAITGGATAMGPGRSRRESETSAVTKTTPPGRHVVLYDGHCRFCAAQTQRLARWARPGTLDLVSFQDADVLDRFPGITHAACMAAMHLVTPDGRVFRGFEAAVRAMATRPVLGQIAWLYYVPGIRQLCDWIYGRIAANRYRIMGKAVAAGECTGGTCQLHVPKH